MKFLHPRLARRLCALAFLAVPTFVLAQTPTYVVTPARLVNLAVRSTLAANESLITGFVISGPTPATMLVRASGPALTPLGVSGVMPNPRLQITDSTGRVVAENDDWAPQGSVQLEGLSVGAFPLPPSSRDAAITVTLDPGAYTLVISGSTSSDAGVVVGELYHLPRLEPEAAALARGDKPPSKIVNLSVRGRIGGSSGMIGGFVVGGSVTPVSGPESSPSKRFLIRVVGPALAGFDVPGSLVDPTLELARTDGTVIQTNDNWDADATAAAAIREATSAAGAFPLPPGSRDAAVVVRLPEGAYTVTTRGANGSTGAALIEIYELEN